LGEILTSNGADGFQVSPYLTFNATSNILSTNSLSLSNNISVTENAIIGQNATIGGVLTVDGDAIVDESLIVELTASFGKDVTMFGNLVVSENETIDGDLLVAENVTINQSLTVIDNATVDGNIAVGDDLTVVGETAFNYGSSGVFTMPTTGGNNGNPLISTGSGTTKWYPGNIIPLFNAVTTTFSDAFLQSGATLGGSGDITVTFSVPYISPPIVVGTPFTSGGFCLVNVTNTNFTFTSSDSHPTHWMAIGKIA